MLKSGREGAAMKWINHQIVTGVVIYTATNDPLCTVYSMLGTLLPDKLEGDPRKAADYWSWRSSHRGWSHWPVPYLSFILLLLTVESHRLAGDGFAPTAQVGIWIMAGALLHILEDAVCGKVPLVYLTKKTGLKLFKVGSFREYFFAIFLVLAAWAAKILAVCQGG